MIDAFLDWSYNLLEGFNGALHWFITPIVEIGGISLTPLTLISFGGLVSFLVVAIVKWGIS